MPPDATLRPIPSSVFGRLAAATRYAITGVAPDGWFGPQQPLQPQAPAEVKGRQFDYPFGVNLNYVPRSDAGISFAELRALADALPLLRSVIETRKDQVAAQNFTVRPRRSSNLPDAAARVERALAFLARPDRRHSFRRLAENAARRHAGHRRGDDLSALQSRRRALRARHRRRRHHQAADRRGRARARAARPGLSAGSARRAGRRLHRTTNSSICRAIRAPTGSTA